MRPLSEWPGARLNALPLDALYAELGATGLVRRLIELARDEDLGVPPLDLTSELVGRRGGTAAAELRARSGGVVSGLAALGTVASVFAEGGAGSDIGVGGGVVVEALARDGEPMRPGEVLARIYGPSAAVTMAERVMLNLVGRLSGVATLTAEYVSAARAGGPAVVCDTRKTTPGLRALEKYAVRCGGGWTHRLGLYDAVLIKDNHLAGLSPDEAGRVARRVAESARPRLGADGFIEVEVDTLDQLGAVLTHAGGLIDAVLLDNMAPAVLREAVRVRDTIAPGVLTEASGGVGLGTIGAIAACGVERISVGALTHSAVSIDVGLDAAHAG